MESPLEQGELKLLLEKNNQLLQENHVLLLKIHRHEQWRFWVGIVGGLIFFVLPVVISYYFLIPYLETLQATTQYNFADLPMLLQGLQQP